MAWKGRAQVNIDPDKLKGVLLESGFHSENPAAHQVLNSILDGSAQTNERLDQKLGVNDLISTTQLKGKVPIANGGTQTGIYTPELTLVANLAGAGINPTIFYRIGDYINVSGMVQASPIAFNAVTRLGISLPLISYFNFDYQCSGIAVCPFVRNECAAIFADVANNRAQMEWLSGYNGVPQNWFYQFIYRIVQQ